MPLDGHSYLVSQGWQGKGSGLRHGAINRPVIIAQKKTLSGVGKDRDEAFPFWDQYVAYQYCKNVAYYRRSVFSAAVNAVKIKVYNSDSVCLFVLHASISSDILILSCRRIRTQKARILH